MPTEPHMQAPPIRVAPGAAYADDQRRFQGIPGIERAPSGRLWATWYGGGDTEDRGNYVMLATSADNGDHWSSPALVIDPDGDGPVRAYDPCLWLDPAGRLWLCWAQAMAMHTGTGVWAIVTDDPDAASPTWSAPRRLFDGIMMNKPTVLSTGEWLAPVARWKREGSSQVYRSDDRGATWRLLGQATIPKPEDRNCDEHMLIERRDGALWMLTRTQYGIGESVSRDRGATWPPIAPSPIMHPHARFYIRRLASGALLLVKHGPLAEQTGRTRLTAYLSDDDGRTWRSGLLLDGRERIAYPDGAQAPDGTIYVIYDRGRTTDKEILLARFTEEDVARGECVSRSAAMGIVVNKATGQRRAKPD